MVDSRRRFSDSQNNADARGTSRGRQSASGGQYAQQLPSPPPGGETSQDQIIKEALLSAGYSQNDIAAPWVADKLYTDMMMGQGGQQSASSSQISEVDLPQSGPTPSSREANSPPAASGASASPEAEGGSGNTLLGILGAAVGTTAAYKLYKMIARGDNAAIEEAKNILGSQAATDAQTAGDEATRQPAQITSDTGTQARLPAPSTDEVMYDDYENVDPARMDASSDDIPYSQIIADEQRMAAPVARGQVEGPPQQQQLRAPTIDELIDDVMRSSDAGSVTQVPPVQNNTPSPNMRQPRLIRGKPRV